MNRQPPNDVRRKLPAIGSLMERQDVIEALGTLPRSLVLTSLRAEIESARQDTSNGHGAATADELVRNALDRAGRLDQPSLKRAINATGIILHTGLGRAVLCQEAQEAIREVVSGHSAVEVELETGRRGSRQDHVRGLLCELTGAESALVVNNNAGAVFLSVNALAAGRDVILSRGELVEIGGSFRMPDIIRASGATLVEVGTTNRTRLADFERAITNETGLLLRCHPSNFRIVGFTEEVAAQSLARLGKEHGIPVMDDLGSGAILDTASLGAGPTITLSLAVESGVDIVTASGDKLLGGPQAGIIVGRKEYIERIARHPLARALRIDKLTLAALEATLRLYREPQKALERIPTLRYFSRSAERLQAMASELKSAVQKAGGNALIVETVSENSQVGGGSLPGENLPTTCVRIQSKDNSMSADEIATRLRRSDPPIFARIKDGAILLDPRTMEPHELSEVAAALDAICG